MSTKCCSNNAVINIPEVLAGFFNDHFGNVKCFLSKLSPKTNFNHTKKLSIILSTRRKIPI